MRILGIDEVGRGSIAGPLVVCGVVLNSTIKGLADSKKLTRTQREKLCNQICNDYNRVIIVTINSMMIDQLGLSECMRTACSQIFSGFSKQEFDKVVIDGNVNYLKGRNNTETIIGADDLVDEVMAASIVAKVARDNYMLLQSVKYPEYMFDKNVGYGTAQHLKALNNFGYTKQHRKTFKPVDRYVSESRTYSRGGSS